MAVATVRKRTEIGRKKAESLLYPMAAFLRVSGLAKKDAGAAFSHAYDHAIGLKRQRQIDHIGHYAHCADIVARWIRDERFIDQHGHPAALSLTGKKSFSMLVRLVHPQGDPESVLSVLGRYGNVRRTRTGKFELIKPIFFTSNRKRMAFEPDVCFLADASRTLERLLTRKAGRNEPEPFWRKVESCSLSPAAERKFMEYVRQRSLTFLNEVDDWLLVHSQGKRSRNQGKRRRVGIGLFSVYSDPEANLST